MKSKVRPVQTNEITTMIDYERGLYVRIEELERGPHPKPLSSGFSLDVAYRVVGIYNPSESGECWLIMSNDADQLWYISQRHVRTVGLDNSETRLRYMMKQSFNDEENGTLVVFPLSRNEGTNANL